MPKLPNPHLPVTKETKISHCPPFYFHTKIQTDLQIHIRDSFLVKFDFCITFMTTVTFQMTGLPNVMM